MSAECRVVWRVCEQSGAGECVRVCTRPLPASKPSHHQGTTCQVQVSATMWGGFLLANVSLYMPSWPTCLEAVAVSAITGTPSSRRFKLLSFL